MRLTPGGLTPAPVEGEGPGAPRGLRGHTVGGWKRSAGPVAEEFSSVLDTRCLRPFRNRTV